MPRDALYIACYDITDTHERNRVADVFGGYGMRVQKSVFECRLSHSKRSKLLDALTKLDLKTGFVYLYKLDASAKRLSAGALPQEPFSEDKFTYQV